MIFPDANLLLLSYDSNARLHKLAAQWLSKVFSGDEPVGLPLLSVNAFVRISTDHRLPRTAMRMEAALEVVESWLDLPHVSLVHTSDRTWELTAKCIMDARVAGAMTTDAQLAAIAIEHGATLYSNDRDFARFKQLRWVDPLS